MWCLQPYSGPPTPPMVMKKISWCASDVYGVVRTSTWIAVSSQIYSMIQPLLFQRNEDKSEDDAVVDDDEVKD